MSIVNIFELEKIDETDYGDQVYHVSGMGQQLAYFYTWIVTHTPSFEAGLELFPGKDFMFRDPADEEKFLAEWGNWIDLSENKEHD